MTSSSTRNAHSTVRDKALVIDDEPAVRTALAQTLDLAEIEVEAVESVADGLKRVSPNWPGAIVTDMRMPNLSGSDLLEKINEMDRTIPVIILTGQGDIPTAVRAMADGAYDFLEKPCAPNHLVDVIRRACEKRRLVLENRRLRHRLAVAEAGALTANILGEAPATRAYREQLARIARTDLDVLLVGETGAGKELAARALHAQSDRKAGPFVAINCGALPSDLAGSELFGHEQGAFTGATRRRIGKFEHAAGGTILLDEIESMPMELQIKLLRILQERELERLGNNTPIPLDIRVIAASKADLQAEAEKGTFRQDLYFRLDVAQIEIPPMRDRLEDAPFLFRAFVAGASSRLGIDPPRVTSAEDAQLMAYMWPGNVRELKNAAERFAVGLGLKTGMVQGGGSDISTANGSSPGGQSSLSDSASLSERLEAFERSVVTDALKRTSGRVTEACELLGLPRKTFYDRVKRLGVVPEDYRG